jgi:hypothetical protein
VPKGLFDFSCEHALGSPNRAFLKRQQVAADKAERRVWQAELWFSGLAGSRLFYLRVSLP